MQENNEKNIAKIEKIKQELESGFFGFWTKYLRVSILVLILLIVWGIFSLYMIPKESSPKVDIWYISITTIYQWVSPMDIDTLITDKIEKQIKDIDGIKKITSTSSVWVSNTVVEVKTWYKSKDVMSDIKSEVDKVSLPSSVEKPTVTEITNSSELLYFVYVFWDEKKFSKFDLIQKWKYLKNKLEASPSISKVTLVPAWDYKINVLIDKSKLEQLGISLTEIASAIRANNKNTPIWNYNIWDLNYDFRFDWELTNVDDLKKVIVKSSWSSVLRLEDIATFDLAYNDKSENKYWNKQTNWNNFIQLQVDKSSIWVFTAAAETKPLIENLFKNDPELKWLSYSYSTDLSEYIIDDYKSLANTWLQTLFLVFVTILFFISLKESLIATLVLPLSFFVTFIFLYYAWYSLNFMTNFSLVLSLTIWIDTIIVIVEWASEKQKLGYDKKYAILLAIKEFNAPLISGTLTTLVVFLPMLSLPWVMWKFLTYIPLTVFSTLLAWLIIALTISSAVFMMFARGLNYYFREEEVEKNMTPEQKLFLDSQREGKFEMEHSKLWLKWRTLAWMWKMYYNYLEKTLKSKWKKKFVIWLPIVLTVLSLVFLSPLVWFKFYSWDDLGTINITITWKQWATEKSFQKYLPELEKTIWDTKDLKSYSLTTSWNKIKINVNVVKKDERTQEIEKTENEITSSLNFMVSHGFDVTVATQSNWPPGSGWVLWVKLVSTNASKLEELKKVSGDFEKFFKSLKWTKNVKNSSSDTPWQFVFKFDEAKLSQLWLTSNDMLWEIYPYVNGMEAWSIKSKFEDNNIVLKIKDFEDGFSPDDLLNIMVNTRAGKVRIWDVAAYNFTKSVSAVNRENNKISISVTSDIEEWYLPTDLQPQLDKFMQNYKYPEGISYEVWWENADNAELITAMISAFFLSLFMMFAILVVQFNSYKQPGLILFSVLLSVLWVNIWLYLTGTPYWMMFMIWFIALAWIVINDAIILVDRANRNLAKGLEPVYAIATAWQSRLQPILVTTITTVLWVWPMALQSPMWAWLGYTIMFGILAWSLLTIFCIPLIYHNIYLKQVEKRKWIFVKIFLFITWPIRKIFWLFTKKRKKS